MLTARTKSGKIISLGDQYEKNYLLDLRKKEEFFCRQCSNKLILKLGTKKVFHFAHEKGSECTNDYDRESEYHLIGKLQLYKWLKNQGLSPKLEPYFPEIRQRADISFQVDGTTFCLEFQCATIPEEIYIERTKGYKKLSFHPIWILGGKNINRKRKQKVSLSKFQTLFLRRNSNDHWYLPSYCPEMQKFIFLHHITPVSARNAFCQFLIKPIVQTNVSDLLNVQNRSAFSVHEWRTEINKYTTCMIGRKNAFRDPFLLELYSFSLNPQLLPPFVGVPLKFNLSFQQSPIVWQTYFFIDHLYGGNAGKTFSFHDVLISALKRIKKNQITLRTLPNIKERLLPFAFKEYLSFLCKVGVLDERNHNHFILNQPIQLAKNIEEQMESERKFFEQNGIYFF